MDVGKQFGLVGLVTALLVSGGHTLIVDVPEWGVYRVLGRTRDDAAGEAGQIERSGGGHGAAPAGG